MAENKKATEVLVFIPSPGIGHLQATMEMANLLIDRDERLSIVVLVIKPYFGPKSTTTTAAVAPAAVSAEDQSYSNQESDPRIRIIDLPHVDPLSIFPSDPLPFVNAVSRFVEGHKDYVRNAVAKLFSPESCTNRRLVGFVVDMFCTSMIDVANEFAVPTYLFYTSSAAILGLLFHFQSLQEDKNQAALETYRGSEVEVSIPTYRNAVPAKLFPSSMLDNDDDPVLLKHTKRFRETKGILINTFMELETIAIKSLSGDETSPPVYPIGPILHSSKGTDENNPKYGDIMGWLDEQPDSSVVFLCFGSKGCFGERQVKEITSALEGCGHRFLWSLRKPPVENAFGSPSEYEDFGEVLPKGFLERTTGFGKVIGWAPQVAVLRHSAVAGFVSHCGWNSILESVWCGVAMAAWPLYAEQQMNAFALVKDLELALEIKMDYRMGGNMIVSSDEIEKGIRSLMDPHSNVRAKWEEMRVKSRMATAVGGSSYTSMEHFIENAINYYVS